MPASLRRWRSSAACRCAPAAQGRRPIPRPALPCAPALIALPPTLPQKLWMRGLPELSLVGGPAEGRVVVITGPTSGIGKETAAALAARGAHGEAPTAPWGERLPACVQREQLPAERRCAATSPGHRAARRPSRQTRPPAPLTSPACSTHLAHLAAVVLACRSIPKGEALKAELEAAAAAAGQPAPKLEVRRAG